MTASEQPAVCQHCAGSRGPLLWTLSGWVHDRCGDPYEVVSALRSEVLNVAMEMGGQFGPATTLDDLTDRLDRFAEAVRQVGVLAGKRQAHQALGQLIFTNDPPTEHNQ